MIVYLCGPINGCSDEEAMMWRQMARERLAQHGHDVLDPNRTLWSDSAQRCIAREGR